MVEHERLCPKVELKEKKWGESEWKIKVWKKWKEESEFSFKKENAPKSINCLR